MWNSVRESVRNATEDFDRLLELRSKSNNNSKVGKQGNKNAMTNVVTPNTIPKFTVPPLLTYASTDLVQEEEKHFEVHCDSDKSSRRSSFNKDRPNLLTTAEILPSTEQIQPGLSLSHLLHTKSGFSTLSESPNTRRKESLFLSPSPTYHLCNEINTITEQRSNEAGLSSSESEHSRSQTPAVSPMLSLLKRRNNPLLYHRPDSESNSSCNTSPNRSPIPTRKQNILQKSSQGNCKESCSNYQLSCNCLSSSTNLKKSFLGDKTRDGNNSKNLNDSSNEVSKKLPQNQKTLKSKICKTSRFDTNTTPARVHLSMMYFMAQRRLDVSIIDITDIVGERLLYLKICLLPRHGASHRSGVLKTSTNKVEVRQRFSFEGINKSELLYLSLKISCKEKGTKLRPSTQLGVAILTLADIEFSSSFDTWLELKDPTTEDVPHLQLSLCYHAILGFVTIEVIAVRNVPRGHLGRIQDCYVVLTEERACEGTAKKQTKISHRCKDPVFKESFIFAMPNDHLVIVAALFVRDKMKGHWLPCGQIKLGHGIEDWSGQAQWTQALDKEGQSVTYWHVLRID